VDYYLIVDMSQNEWKRMWDHEELPQRKRPRYIHWYRDNAEKELLRLKKDFPDGDFVLFKAVAHTRKLPDGKSFQVVPFGSTRRNDSECNNENQIPF
jgi:hypothetical protein